MTNAGYPGSGAYRPGDSDAERRAAGGAGSADSSRGDREKYETALTPPSLSEPTQQVPEATVQPYSYGQQPYPYSQQPYPYTQQAHHHNHGPVVYMHNAVMVPHQGQHVSTNGLAVASLITGIFFLGPIPLALGIVGLRQIATTKQRGKGLAVAGIVLGSISAFSWIVPTITWMLIR